CPLTKCVSGTLIAALRPGSAASAAGIVVFLRNSAMAWASFRLGRECGDRRSMTQEPAGQAGVRRQPLAPAAAATVSFAPHGHQSAAEPAHSTDRETAPLWDPCEPAPRRPLP